MLYLQKLYCKKWLNNWELQNISICSLSSFALAMKWRSLLHTDGLSKFLLKLAVTASSAQSTSNFESDLQSAIIGHHYDQPVNCSTL